jgi:hypothetical protein
MRSSGRTPSASKFFAGLAECHASIVRAPIELSPERQLELAVEAAQQDALRRVELEQAAEQQAAARSVARVEAFRRSTAWSAAPGSPSAPTTASASVKLAWVSPLRTCSSFPAPTARKPSRCRPSS